MEYINLAGLRIDGRKPEEARKLAAKLHVLPEADGSAIMAHGATVVLAQVHGPAPAPPSRRGSMRNDTATLHVEYQYVNGPGSSTGHCCQQCTCSYAPRSPRLNTPQGHAICYSRPP